MALETCIHEKYIYNYEGNLYCLTVRRLSLVESVSLLLKFS